MNIEKLIEELRILANYIEAIPASVEQTQASIVCSDLIALVKKHGEAQDVLHLEVTALNSQQADAKAIIDVYNEEFTEYQQTILRLRDMLHANGCTSEEIDEYIIKSKPERT